MASRELTVTNPWPGARCVLFDETDSTMDEARRLAGSGAASGSVVIADYQRQGRGRLPGRRWDALPGESLLFTLVLSGERGIPGPVTLLAGLALLDAVETTMSGEGPAGPGGEGSLRSSVRATLKWPNDLLLDGRKAAGILCESGPRGILVGVGLNLLQRSFAGDLADRATSLALAYGRSPSRESLLESFLARFHALVTGGAWKERYEGRMAYRGEIRRFAEGAGDRGMELEARILGVGDDGALNLELPDGRRIRSVSGELAGGSVPV